MNIYEKIQKISEELGNLQPDLKLKSSGKNYSAISESKIIEAVKPLETKYKVYSFVEKGDIKNFDAIRLLRAEGEQLFFYSIVSVCVKFVNAEDPKESFTVEALGGGSDYGDKSVGKAYTYAYKYALLKTYSIRYSDDTDAWASTETYTKVQNAPLAKDYDKISDKQLSWAKSLLTELKMKETDVLLSGFMSGYKLEELPKETAGKLIEYLKALKEEGGLPF